MPILVYSIIIIYTLFMVAGWDSFNLTKLKSYKGLPPKKKRYLNLIILKDFRVTSMLSISTALVLLSSLFSFSCCNNLLRMAKDPKSTMIPSSEREFKGILIIGALISILKPIFVDSFWKCST